VQIESEVKTKVTYTISWTLTGSPKQTSFFRVEHPKEVVSCFLTIIGENVRRYSHETRSMFRRDISVDEAMQALKMEETALRLLGINTSTARALLRDIMRDIAR
jgi:hypothetical protein